MGLEKHTLIKKNGGERATLMHGYGGEIPSIPSHTHKTFSNSLLTFTPNTARAAQLVAR